MEKSSVAGVLRALAQEDKGRSETARLRDVFGEVEAALDAGVKRQTILEALNEQGFTMTLKSFESALYRIRKQQKTGHQAERTPAPQTAALPAKTQPTPSTSDSDANVTSEAAAETTTDAVRGAIDQQSREEKFSRYSSSSLTKRLGNKKES
ncbi:hypothetical protein PP724_22835 [Ralstonia solanacearum]|uniref:hypothetical protein n=1 Tax=Ralstonia solanacearum TaxID=305 RepID=UPI001FF924C0|nr:hypothetical protein [Ralstonia solanacearum]MDC6237003.1 hypothetical protein [Ralstonia solanacearum]MDD7810564.1 hypothetical protein [Ralstonia solanacearum]